MEAPPTLFQLPFQLPDQPGFSYTWKAKSSLYYIDLPHGRLRYAPHFLSKKVSHDYQTYFRANEQGFNESNTDWRSLEKEALKTIRFSHIQWRHDTLKMFGKVIYQPRYTAWHGDPDRPYTYSGLTMQPAPWTPELLSLKTKIDEIAGIQFNSVLLNWYRDGGDHMGWHQDNEKELGANPIIASLNFGATRRFLLRSLQDKKLKVELPLYDGSLLIMEGETQHFWQHSLPKQLRVKNHRFNLTFRVINL